MLAGHFLAVIGVVHGVRLCTSRLPSAHRPGGVADPSSAVAGCMPTRHHPAGGCVAVAAIWGRWSPVVTDARLALLLHRSASRSFTPQLSVRTTSSVASPGSCGSWRCCGRSWGLCGWVSSKTATSHGSDSLCVDCAFTSTPSWACTAQSSLLVFGRFLSGNTSAFLGTLRPQRHITTAPAQCTAASSLRPRQRLAPPAPLHRTDWVAAPPTPWPVRAASA